MAPQDALTSDFQADRPFDFNIHHHDGLIIRYPVRLTETGADSGRFVAQEERSYCLMWFNQSLMSTSLPYRIGAP